MRETEKKRCKFLKMYQKSFGGHIKTTRLRAKGPWSIFNKN